ncbi:MAG: 2-hydroxyacid dehydrogenase [Clostridia bacterium]|nr:2-hydroxyacid dehydrogenase [Clostridia bacterium]
MNKRILVTNNYSESPRKIVFELAPEGFDVETVDANTKESLLEKAPDTDYILASGRLKIDANVLANAPKLKMIQRTGVGLDSLDLNELKDRGIPLYVNQGINAQSVAEHALLLMLACLRRLTVIDANTKRGVWKKQEQGVHTHELCGKTVGIIGMGNIAKRLVAMLRPFGVKINYFNIFREDECFEKENNMRYVSLEELLADSDIVSIHCALNDETRGLINAERIELMKQGAMVINTARGGIVDAHALADALTSGKLASAGLDVHESEPFDENYPLSKLSNVILTPHIGGITEESFSSMIRDAFRNIAAFEKGDLESIEQYKYL